MRKTLPALNRPVRIASLLLATLVCGCNSAPEQLDAPISVQGVVQSADGTAIGDVQLTLQPMENGHMVTADVDSKGQFTAEIVPGKYAYSIGPAGKRSVPKGVDAKYLEPSMEHTVQVASGQPIEVKLN